MSKSESLRVLHVVGSTRVDHGGTSRSVPAICESLSACGLDVELLTGKTSGVRSNVPAPPVITHLVSDAPGLGRILKGPAFSRRLTDFHLAGSLESIVHDHGIWLPSNHAVATSTKKYGGIRVVSPRGMASPWALANSGFKKKMAWQLYQKRDLETATAFHATASLEAEELRKLGLKQPIAVIPNGIDLPETMPARSRVGGKKRMIFMSRVHPKKGLINLVKAWKAADVSDEWELLLVGPDEGGHRNEVECAIQSSGLAGSISFYGEVNDSEKWQQLVDAEVFVLPSFSENFGIVVAEALAAGLPVITTNGTPWEQLEQNQIGWWVAPDLEPLTNAIIDACCMPEEQRLMMGRRAAEWATHQFRWDGIASQMLEFYVWLLGGGKVPAFVQRLECEDRPGNVQVA